MRLSTVESTLYAYSATVGRHISWRYRSVSSSSSLRYNPPVWIKAMALVAMRLTHRILTAMLGKDVMRRIRQGALASDCKGRQYMYEMQTTDSRHAIVTA